MQALPAYINKGAELELVDSRLKEFDLAALGGCGWTNALKSAVLPTWAATAVRPFTSSTRNGVRFEIAADLLYASGHGPGD